MVTATVVPRHIGGPIIAGQGAWADAPQYFTREGVEHWVDRPQSRIYSFSWEPMLPRNPWRVPHRKSYVEMLGTPVRKASEMSDSLHGSRGAPRLRKTQGWDGGSPRRVGTLYLVDGMLVVQGRRP